MTQTVHVNELRGQIDFAVITIREDEFEAILKRFRPHKPVIGGRQIYEYCRFRRTKGQVATVAMVRTFDQGQSVAQSVARDTIEDLQPRWLFLVGIAGGLPDSEFTLGDVLLASSLHDFSVTAAVEDQKPQFRPSGGGVHKAVARLLGHLPASRARLGKWNGPKALKSEKPSVEVPDDPRADCYYGSPKTREDVCAVLKQHFSGEVRPPLYRVGALATANVLLKDTELLDAWRSVARHITHVEMEAGGVYLGRAKK